MNVRNCRKCGRIYNFVPGHYICPVCEAQREEDFQRTKEYVRDHPNCSVNEVVEECHVEMQQIQQWLREERLQLADTSGIMLTCEKCGEPIQSGRYCEKCKRTMTDELGAAARSYVKVEPSPAKKKQEHDGDKMRFLGK